MIIISNIIIFINLCKGANLRVDQHKKRGVMMNSTLETFKQYQGHLMLHFDINKTLVATDCAGGKPDVDMVVQELLAEKTFACWAEQLDSPISYS